MRTLNDSTQTAFDTMSTGYFRYPVHQLLISWLRKIGADSFGVVGLSTVNNALVKGENQIITPTDTFEFFDETENAIRVEYDRRVEEPLGGLSFGLTNVVLDNTDKRFTPNYNATIGTALIPNRPLKIALGFNLKDGKKMMEIFKGLTEMPKENKVDRTVEFGGMDYVSYLRDLEMKSVVYSSMRSDEIIEEILIEAGFGSSQYVLDVGLNTLGFVWFKSGETASERIKKICEAEEGHFFQDEMGILRFQNRRKYSYAPYNAIQKYIHDNDILDWIGIEDVGIYNSVLVNASPRKIYDTNVEVWRDGIVEEIYAKDSLVITASMKEPTYSFEDPVGGVDFVANSASDGSGTDLTANITITLVGYAENAQLTIVNNGTQKTYITFLRLKGKPALVTSEIQQKYEDNASIARYGKRILNIENDFIDSDSFAYYLARTTVGKYKDPLKRIRILIRGMPQLQLKDKLSVYDRDLGTYKLYRIMGIQGIFQTGEFLQYLTLREVTSYEADSWAIVGTTLVGAEREYVGV